MTKCREKLQRGPRGLTGSLLSSVPGTGNLSLARQVQPGLCLELPTRLWPWTAACRAARSLAGGVTAPPDTEPCYCVSTPARWPLALPAGQIAFELFLSLSLREVYIRKVKTIEAMFSLCVFPLSSGNRERSAGLGHQTKETGIEVIFNGKRPRARGAHVTLYKGTR